MKTIPIALCALCALAVAAIPAGAADRRHPVTDFERVSIEGPYRVRLITGAPSAALVSGSQAAIGRVTVEVQGRTLRIRPSREGWGSGGVSDGPVDIELRTRILRGASVNGPGSLAVDRASGMRLDLNVGGSGRISVAAVESDLLSVTLVGAGRVAVGGKAKDLRAVVQGSGDLDAAGLQAERADITSDSAGSISVAVRDTAKVTASGIGDILVAGKPACTVRGLGAHQVRCGR